MLYEAQDLMFEKGVDLMYYAIICVYTATFIAGTIMDIITALD